MFGYTPPAPMTQPYLPLPYQTPQPQPTQQVQTGPIWVNGRAEADQYQVEPNKVAALWDRNEQVIYLKSADNTGRYTTEVLEYHSRDEEGISREEFDSAIDKLTRQINSIRSNLKNPNNPNYQGGDVNG